MCTLTYIPTVNGEFYFTTNRDEGFGRKSAVDPQLYCDADVSGLFPVDGQAHGTWIGINEMGILACLLNGAAQQHRHQPPYAKSRGLVVRELLADTNPIRYLEGQNLDGIEPFTLIVISTGLERIIDEYRWDGKILSQKNLDASKPFIYSSSTLYDPNAQQQREHWFKTWLADSWVKNLDVLSFHQSSGLDSENDILLRRANVGTLSISSIHVNNQQATMRYVDLVNSKEFSSQLLLKDHA